MSSDPPFETAPIVKAGRAAPLIWTVPLIAVIIGAWLVYQEIRNTGLRIEVTFASGAGVEAGKTRIKYRDVDVGRVEAVHLMPDLSGVRVEIELSRTTAAFLTDATRFWVVAPRLEIGEISGLETLVSGVYIAMDPSDTGTPTRQFQGLEAPPVIRSGQAGTEYVLVTDTLGSVTHGAPVLYRGINVGEVLGFALDQDGTRITVPVFVRAPYDKLVRPDTRFWNASGISVDLGAEGLKIQASSLQSLIRGGINFETGPGIGPVSRVSADHRFPLYKTREDVEDVTYVNKRRFLLYFDGSVRGLSIGAPVEFRGIKVGEVLDVRLEYDPFAAEFRIPVLISLEPDRVHLAGNAVTGAQNAAAQQTDEDKEVVKMVLLGLRARLETASLLTGQLFVALDMYPNTLPTYRGDLEAPYPEIPTLPQQLEQITNSLTALMNKVERLPLNDISQSVISMLDGIESLSRTPEIPEALNRITTAAHRVEALMGRIDRETLPDFEATITEAVTAFKSIRNLVGPTSGERVNLDRILDELAQAARSARLLAAYLEHNPNALVLGK